MRLVFTCWESGCEEVYTKGWKILADSIISTSRDVVIFHGDVLALEDGTVVRFVFLWPSKYTYTSSGTKKPYLTGSSLSSSRFISLHAAYGKLFLVNEEGRLFGCGHTACGECGVISSIPVESLREIELVPPLAVCPHGSVVTAAESLKVRLVQTSSSEVCVTDFRDQLWKYGGGRLEFDSLGRIQVQPLQLAPRRKVLQLCAGRKHFVCLAVPLTGKDDDTDVESSPTSEVRKLNKCEKCQEDARQHQSLHFCSSSRIVKTTAANQWKNTSFNEFEMKEMKNINTWDRIGKHSTLVSIGNLPDMYYMQNTKELSSSCTVHNESPSKSDGSVLSSSQDDPDILPEIWTWGANENGQLGHDDLAVRRAPFKIVGLSGMYCVKVAAGDNHTIALTAAGKLYVWGSNSDGQLKQANLSSIAKPTLFKVGSHSFVLDAFANGCQTGIIVGGVANSITLYLCGGNTVEKSPQSLSLPKEIGWPSWILIEDKDLAVGVHESIDEVDEHILRVFVCFRYAEFVQRMWQICQKMHERSDGHTGNSLPLSKLLNKLTLSLAGYSTHIFRLMKMMRDSLCDTGSLSIGKLFEAHIKEKEHFLNAFFNFHADFVECVAYGCFTELDIGDEIYRTDWDDIIAAICSEKLDEEVNKMCLCYDVGENSQEVRLRQLFQLLFNCPCKLGDVAGIGNILEVRISFASRL
ncbi:unnamed protein product [Litomosoides sigmodontis]|uniref:Uncharacterized protein n=1 Tax=Litomosoides sigmodontis TaxID=42156 RepID=A0A3P6SW76_LITSI|nr:unnamed protein product [Litomosoides sigmodontis]